MLIFLFSCFSLGFFVVLADELETAATVIQSPKILSLEEIKRRKALKEQQQKQEEGEGKDRDLCACVCVCLSVCIFVCWCVLSCVKVKVV